MGHLNQGSHGLPDQPLSGIAQRRVAASAFVQQDVSYANCIIKNDGRWTKIVCDMNTRGSAIGCVMSTIGQVFPGVGQLNAGEIICSCPMRKPTTPRRLLATSS